MGSRHKGEATCLNRAEGESVTPVQHLHPTAGPHPYPHIHESSSEATGIIFSECQQTLFSMMGFMLFKQIHHSSMINRICILMNRDEVVQRRSQEGALVQRQQLPKLLHMRTETLLQKAKLSDFLEWLHSTGLL